MNLPQGITLPAKYSNYKVIECSWECDVIEVPTDWGWQEKRPGRFEYLDIVIEHKETRETVGFRCTKDTLTDQVTIITVDYNS